MLSELKKFAVAFSLALILVFIGYKLFVRPCNLLDANNQPTKTCKCLGKVLNLQVLLGSQNPWDLPKTESCIGIIYKNG